VPHDLSRHFLKSSGEARPLPALTCSAIFLIAPRITPVAPVKPPSARPVPPPKPMPPPSARADQPAQADQPSTNGSQANKQPRARPAGSAFSGLTAWWLHGLDVKLPTPVEATAPYGTGVSARAALSLKHGSLPPGDVVSRLGLPVT
jgi:hypothetical protein